MYFAKRIGTLFLIITMVTGLLYLKPTGVVHAAALTSTIEVKDTSLIIGETSLVTIVFSDPVTGVDLSDLTVMNGILSSLSTSDNITYTATLTPNYGITAATNVITLNNAGVFDQAGQPGSGITVSNNYAIDTQRPTATIVVADTLLSAGEMSLVTFTFSEAVTGFTLADLTVSNGTLSGLSSSDGGITWTSTFMPASGIRDVTNVITLNNAGVADIAGNPGSGATVSNNYELDTIRPTATIVVGRSSLKIGETSSVTITFSEAVSGFDHADLTVANGTLNDVSSSDGGITWTSTFTPALGVSDATNVITLDNTGVQNAAGNVGLGTTVSNNYAVDTQRPTATIVVADSVLGIGKASTVTITFSEAVTGFTLADLTVSNGILSGLGSTDGGITWTATLTPAVGITHPINLITLDNTRVTDRAGNTGKGTTNSNNYVIDSIRPTATITVVDTSLAAGDTTQVVFTFSEAVTGFTLADLTVSNGILSNLGSIDGGITWTATLTPTPDISSATNVITLDNAGVADIAGNAGVGVTDSNNYTIHTIRPTSAIVVTDTSLTAGETTVVTFTFSEAVTGFTLADLTVSNGILSNLGSTDGGITWEATLTPTPDITNATNVITLDNTGVQNAAGNAGLGTTDSNHYEIDTQRPAATIVVEDASLSIGETSRVTITFTEAVSGFDNGDLTIDNGTLSAVSSSDNIIWTATLTPNPTVDEATNTITLDNTGVTDIAGNTGQGTTESNPYSVFTVPASANLSNLTLTNGTLSPVFASGTEVYTSRVPYSVSALTLTASTSDRRATMTVNGALVVSGQPSSNIMLNVGANTITIVVTASDLSTRTYTITVTRENNPSNGGGSSDGGGTSNSGGSSTPTAPVDHTVTASNGKITLPAETPGVVSLGKEITITIPAGALPQELKLTIEKVLNTNALFKNGEILASPVFEVLKNVSENFRKPVKMTLAFDSANLKSDQTAAVFYYDEVKKDWVKVEGGVIKENEITVEVNHFTKFAVLVVDKSTGRPVIDKPTGSTTEITFSDIAGHWAEASIRQAVSEGIATGYTDGTFKPGHSVTRAEFSVMLMNALKPTATGAELTFTDTARIGAWAKKAVSQAVQAGIIHGYEDGTFRPNAKITRAEMATMMANALKVSTKGNAVTSFSDDKAIPVWAKGSVAALKELGIVKGAGAGEFNPSAQTTRAEAVIVLMNMLGQTQ